MNIGDGKHHLRSNSKGIDEQVTMDAIDLKISSRLKPLETLLHSLDRQQKTLLKRVARLSSQKSPPAAVQPLISQLHQQDHQHHHQVARSSSRRKRREDESSSNDSTSSSEDGTRNSSEEIIQLLSNALYEFQTKKKPRRKKSHKHR